MTLGDRRDKPLPTITYLAPAAITNYISQTRRRGWKNWKNSPEVLCRKSVFSHSDPQMITRDFSQLWRRSTGECQRFSTFGLIFICHISSLCELGRKEKSIFLTYSEVHPRDIALPAIVNVHFNFGSGHTIFLFGWFCTNTTRAHIAICIFQRHISLLFKFPVCYFQIF